MVQNAVPGKGSGDQLVRLANEVESAVPDDCERALQCLASMRRELQTAPVGGVDEYTGAPWRSPSIERENLGRVITQLERSLVGGHVLAVRGLDRQVRRSLGPGLSTRPSLRTNVGSAHRAAPLGHLTGISSKARKSHPVNRRRSKRVRAVPWPERWPVLGPFVGAMMSTAAAGVAINEDDWGATTIFTVFGTALVLVALRNHRSRSESGRRRV